MSYEGKIERKIVMDKMNCLIEIGSIEKNFSDLINSKLAGFNDENRVITTQVINDAVDLIEDLVRDVYAFDMAFDNYNNGMSFMPQYYFENIVLHDDMIWERIIIIIAIAYQIDFEVIFDKRGIGYLYKIIKKDERINGDIKKIIQDINSDYDMKKLKFLRNGNEHYISTHLSDSPEKDKFKVDIKALIYIKDEIVYGDVQKINIQTDNMNREEMKILKNKVSIIQNKKSKYIELLSLCIEQMGIVFKNGDFYLNQKNHFLPEYSTPLCVEKDICSKCEILEVKYGELREELRSVIDMINKNVLVAISDASRIRNTLLIDSLFRAKEIIRSINLYYSCIFYKEEIVENGKREAFKKYCMNEIIYPNYYYFHAMLKLYSVFEKVAKFLLCKYDFKKEYLDDGKFRNMYIDKIVELFSENKITSDILREFYNCISSEEYKMYEKLRNREYHCLRNVYVLDEEDGCIFINDCICKMEKLIRSLYKLFFMIINEEKVIYEKIVADNR